MRIDGPQITGSFNLNGDTVADLDALVTTSSFNMMTASMATTGSNLFKGTQTTSGSIVPSVNNTYDLGSPTHQFRHVYISTGSLYIDGTKVLGSTSSELQITTDVGQSFKVLETGADTITLQSNDGNVTLTSTGGGDIVMDPSTGVIGLKGTVTIYTGNKITSSDGNAIQFGNGISITGSIVATGTNLISGSSQVLNGSGIWSGSAQLPSGIISGSAQLPSGIVSSSAQVTGYGFSTTGSNNFQGTQTITGSLYISSDLVVQGSSSLQNITASAVNIGANIVNLNTANPAIRFAGISVFDSGSIGGSGSFLYDAVQDEFIFIHRGDGTNITSSVTLMGPQTYNNVGNESYPTNNRILKGTGNEHVGDSIISETGGGIGISGSLSITGSIVATGTSLVSGSSQILNGSGIWSGSAQLPSGVVSGSAQTIANLPSGTVSGSVQVDVMSTTNIARLATTGSNTFTSNQIVSGAFTTTGDINVNSSGIIINRNTSGEPYLFFRKDGVNRGSIYGITGGGLRLFDQSDNQVLTMTGSMIGINKSSPSGTLDVQSSGANGIVLSSDSADTNNSGRLFFMRTGGEGWNIFNNSGNLSFRSNAIPGNTSGSERMRLDSSYNLTLNNGLTVAGATNHTGAVRMNNGTGGSSPRITFGTEDESVPGNKSIYLDTYWMILQPHVNEGLRVRFVNGSGTQTETVRLQSTQASFYTSISSSSSISASGNMGARNFNNLVRSWSSNGSYVWHEQLDAIASVFDDGGLYRAFIRESNAAHYYGYMFDINVSSKGYGGTSLQYVVRNMTSSNGAWPAGCGATSFASIDNSGFTKQSSGCFDTLHLYITKIGG
jgi:hypothetical protein